MELSCEITSFILDLRQGRRMRMRWVVGGETTGIFAIQVWVITWHCPHTAVRLTRLTSLSLSVVFVLVYVYHVQCLPCDNVL